MGKQIKIINIGNAMNNIIDNRIKSWSIITIKLFKMIPSYIANITMTSVKIRLVTRYTED